MKEIIIAVVAIVVVSFAAAYGLETMNWSAKSQYTSTQVRL